MPFAIEPTASPALEIPAPIVSTPSSNERATGSVPSFQDHLERAGRTPDARRDEPSSSESRAERNERDDRRDAASASSDQAGERAEAERREERTDPTPRNDGDATEPQKDNAEKASKDAPPKVDGKKKHGSSDRHHEKKKGEDTTGVAVVAAAVVQEPAAKDTVSKDEVTLTEAGPEADAAAAAIAEAARAAAKETAKPTVAIAGKGRHVDPTKATATKAVVSEEDAVKAKAEQATAAAEQNATKETPEVDPAVVATAAPVVSELSSTQTPKKSDKNVKPAAATAETTVTTEAVAEVATTEAPQPTAEAKAATDAPASKPEKTEEKHDGAGKNEAASTAATFAAQLSSAVEATTSTNGATTTAVAQDAAASIDAASAATTPSAGRTDNSTGTTTKLSPDRVATNETFRAALSTETAAARATGSDVEQSGGLSTADRARFVQRVARAVRTTHERGGELQIRLSPPELGQLRLQVQMTDGTLSARIEAETPQAKQLLTENLGVLRDRLAEQNVRVERIDVELMNTGNGGSPNMQDRRNDPPQESLRRGFGTAPRGADTVDAGAADPRASGTTPTTAGRLNVVI
ncbi:MAG: flagellar hook-length control protein FliK [Planctomycetia bacterium]|nr:flagellar hook-length control protein FliK [Planctomycetia bacterium]